MALGIYLHIPFCVQKCLYCDFLSYTGEEKWIESYCRALAKEMEAASRREKREVDSIFFGGGTPTFIGAERLVFLLDQVKRYFVLSEDCEITAECNPGTIHRDGLEAMFRGGFNRLSIGLQSTGDSFLKKLGRIHTFDDFARCFQEAREAGFSNISLDLMYGLPDQTLDDWKESLQMASGFEPEHFSCYSLKVEEGTPFADMKLNLPTDDVIRAMYDEAVCFLRKKGYERYEISNFSKPGRESRHNCKYWKCEDYLGLGAGASACVGGMRTSNEPLLWKYIQMVQESGSAVVEQIPLSLRDQMSEFCFLGLRMIEGISEEEFSQRFGQEITDVFQDGIQKNLERKTLTWENGQIRIPPQFFFVCNEILIDFI